MNHQLGWAECCWILHLFSPSKGVLYILMDIAQYKMFCHKLCKCQTLCWFSYHFSTIWVCFKRDCPIETLMFEMKNTFLKLYEAKCWKCLGRDCPLWAYSRTNFPDIPSIHPQWLILFRHSNHLTILIDFFLCLLIIWSNWLILSRHSNHWLIFSMPSNHLVKVVDFI